MVFLVGIWISYGVEDEELLLGVKMKEDNVG